jgi:MFS family permease
VSATPDTAAGERTLRSLGPSVYLPAFLFAVGQGAVIPIAALVARDLGATVAVAGIVVAVRGLGTMAFDLPAGWMVARWGERRSMSVATLMLLAALVGCVVSTSVVAFGAFMFLMGCGWAVWLLSRMAYVSDVMPIHLRGRALSILGGIQRMGNFAGPFLGALALGPLGLDGAYYVHIVLAAAGLAVLLAVPSLDESGPPAHAPVSFRAVGRAHSSVWLTAGVGSLCIGALRACRTVVLPLWADHVGVDAAAIAVIFGLSSAMDMTLFYPAGAASDRWGRKFVAVPCITIMAAGFALLPAARSFWALVVVGLVLGFGNGLGSGIVMTLGTDFAPVVGRAEFLGVWRVIGDVGTAGGPFLAAGVTGLAGLGAASMTVAAIGAAGAVVVATRMPEPLHRARSSAPPVDPAE